MWLIDQLPSASDTLRILSQKNADEVFLLLDLSFKVWDRGGRGIYQLLSLSYIEHGGGTAIGQDLSQLQRTLSRSECLT